MYLNLYCMQVLKDHEGQIRTQREWKASGSCSIIFLLLEMLSGACAGYVVSLKLMEKLQDFIV